MGLKPPFPKFGEPGVTLGARVIPLAAGRGWSFFLAFLLKDSR